MFDSLIESRSRAWSWRNSLVLLAAALLHVAVVGWVMAHDYLKVPPIEEPQLIVEFLQLETLPPPPPPASTTQPEIVDPEPVPKLVEIAVEIPVETADLVLGPAEIPEEIELSEMPDLPPPSSGSSGGIPTGVPGGIVGGLVSAAPLESPEEPLRDPEVYARPIEHADPEYPSRAMRAGVEGTVILEAIIREDGRVSDIRVIQGLRMKCTEAAIEAVRRWRYEPARQNGRAVAQILEVEIEFQLQ